MKRILLILLFVFCCKGFSQEDAWVYFTDKPNAQSYIDNPLSMLTQRALDRRIAQGIDLNVNDAPIHQPYINQITAASGITVKAKSKWLNCLHIRGSVSDINALLALSFVDHIHFANNALNSKLTSNLPITPINKQLDVQSDFNYGDSSNQIYMLNGHLLHQANYTGSGKIIAVLDSGFSAVNTIIPFNRFFNNNLYLGGYNYVGGNTDVFSTHFHGTYVLSCMAGYVDGQLVGTAPDAQYYLFITEDVATENPVEESYWVEAAEEADRLGADIISTSLGYYGYDNPAYSHTYSDMTGNTAFASQGANIAFSKGMIVVASAGNSASSPEPLNHIGIPAEATNVLAVGAVRFDETYAPFSSIGPSYDGRVKPDVMAKGQAAVVSNTAGLIQTASGTSFSCPIMAGMIACLWQAVPSLTNQQLLDVYKQSCDRFTNPDAQFGYGIPDFQMALTNALLLTNANVNTNFQVVPNPVKDVISISFPEGIENPNLIIYNALGQIVVNKTLSNTTSTLSLEDLSSGVYFYKIQSKSITSSGKIVKN
jgi:serine protease AprX